ncbi:hypothetical protein CANARDRAFT_22363 [[Candida] arabinofermentans NRRL YB-2248]|uniref:Trafficking protein particle complex subunit n=1 Tax=[Candida] arabinofermentans NRRL YB-2248 TaxID=983967 RepID=A0A1E4T424_9ASCO|nr:hypothetical protein CANARDRAFT_22363 [[Candida] arabinofermentans NRRL YB-2248]
MAIYSFWVYDRHCNCIYQREYSPLTASTSTSASATTTSQTGSTPRLSQSNSALNNSSVQRFQQSGADNSDTTISNNTSLGSSSVNNKIQELLNNGSINAINDNNVSKLLFGTLFSLRKISISLTSAPASETTDDEVFSSHTSLNKFNELKSFQTLNYKVHFYETLTGLKFLVVTDPTIRDLQLELRNIYENHYLNYVVRNQLCQVEFKEHEVISNDKFIQSVDAFWSGLPEFIS